MQYYGPGSAYQAYYQMYQGSYGNTQFNYALSKAYGAGPYAQYYQNQQNPYGQQQQGGGPQGGGSQGGGGRSGGGSGGGSQGGGGGGQPPQQQFPRSPNPQPQQQPFSFPPPGSQIGPVNPQGAGPGATNIPGVTGPATGPIPPGSQTPEQITGQFGPDGASISAGPASSPPDTTGEIILWAALGLGVIILLRR